MKVLRNLARYVKPELALMMNEVADSFELEIANQVSSEDLDEAISEAATREEEHLCQRKLNG
jgi:hypothetical protein